MVGLFRGTPTQAVHMLFAWAGALAILPVIYRTAAAAMLASPSFRLPILCGLIIATAIILRQVPTQARPAWLSLPVCVVLGALFTSISVSLTMLCAGIFA